VTLNGEIGASDCPNEFFAKNVIAATNRMTNGLLII
jgi:hypothetical protein